MSQNSKDSALSQVSQISSISEESNFISDAQNLKITKEIKKAQLLSKAHPPSQRKKQQHKRSKIKAPLHKSIDLSTLKQIFLQAQHAIAKQEIGPPALSTANRSLNLTNSLQYYVKHYNLTEMDETLVFKRIKK